MRCLSSLALLRSSGCQVILVDNGSTDGSSRILESWCHDHGGLYLVEPNVGVSNARNIGLEHVTAQYVLFLDSDDWLDPQVILKLLRETVAAQADIGRCSVAVVKTILERELDVDLIRVGGAPSAASLLDPSSGLHGVLYRVAFIRENEVFFPPGLVAEDLAFNFLVMCSRPRIIEISEIGYTYTLGCPTSLTSLHNSVEGIADTLLIVKPSRGADRNVMSIYMRLLTRALAGVVRRKPSTAGKASLVLLRVAKGSPFGVRTLIGALFMNAYSFRSSIPTAITKLLQRDSSYLPTGR